MSSKISNTTSLSFEYGSGEFKELVSSVAATAIMNESISINVTSLEKNYYYDEPITYLITINNSGPKTNELTLTHNLGSYKKGEYGENKTITPLSYQEASHMYVNGISKNFIEPEIKPDKIIFNIPSIPEKSNVLLICKMETNQFAPFDLNSKIKATISLKTTDSSNSFEASHIIAVSQKADLKISKTIIPQTFSQGETISYNIILYNYGNTEAKNVKINDIFTPAPILTEVTIDEKEISSSDYSYVNGTFNLPAYGSSLNLKVPSAKFGTDNTLDTVTTVPGVTSITIKGII